MGDKIIVKEIRYCHSQWQKGTGEPQNIDLNIGIIAKEIVKKEPHPNPEKYVVQNGFDFYFFKLIHKNNIT